MLANRTPPGPPMTLANMRAMGVRSVWALCECGRDVSVRVDRLPGDLGVPAVVCRLRCTVCGSRPKMTMPDWREERGVGMGRRG